MATNRQDDEEHREESLNRPVQESPLNDELDDDIERQLPLPVSIATAEPKQLEVKAK